MNSFFATPLLLAQPPAGEGGGSGAVTLITFGLIFVVFYLLIIRPQSKRQKQTKEMLSALQKGDRVVTIGGIHGVVKSLNADSAVIKIGGDNTLEISRSAISKVVGGGNVAADKPKSSGSRAKAGGGASTASKASANKSTKK